jgi:Domain of unknown function (DUF4389)
MSETPEPDEIQPGPPPGPPEEPGGPTEILPTGEQSEAAEAPRPFEPYAAAPDAGGFAAPGSTFADQPWAGPVPADLRSVTGPAPVLMSFGPPASQQRVTVAFRAILAIPHLIVLIALGVAAEVVAFIGWWAALFTGQLPPWAHEFITGVLRWQSRVYGYLYFLTDQYPPFTLEDADYPVRLFTKQTRLNRLAVFFRFILAIPAGLLGAFAGFGILLVSIVAWLITLITGRMPAGLHQAFAAAIRFVARLGGYVLVTPEYPGGLFGDTPSVAAGLPETGEASVFDATAPEEAAAGEATAAEETAGETTAPQEPASAGDPWRLVLPGSAKSLVTVTLVVGLLGFGGYVGGLVAITGSAVNTAQQQASAYNTVTTAYNHLGGVVTSFQSKVQACDQNLSCVTALDGQVAKAFQTFGTELQGAGVPSSYSGEVSALMTDNNSVAADLNKLAGAQSASQYTSVASGLNLEGDLSNWQTAYNQLSKSLQPAG